MNTKDRQTINSGHKKTYTTNDVSFKNERNGPINVLIKTAGGDTIDILLTTGSEFRLIAAGNASLSFLGADDNAFVNDPNKERH